MDSRIFYKALFIFFGGLLLSTTSHGATEDMHTLYYESDSLCLQMPADEIYFNPSNLLPAPAFKGKEFLRENTSLIKVQRTKPSESLPFWILLALALISTISLYVYRQEWLLSVKTVISSKDAQLSYHQKNTSKWFFHVLSFLVLFLGVSLGVLFYDGYELKGMTFSLLWQVPIVIAIMYLIKALSLEVISYLISDNSSIKVSIFQLHRSATLYGILCLPLCFIAIYGISGMSDIAYVLGILLLAALYLNWLIRSLYQIISGYKSYLLHILLYLCAFEILPVLLWWKNIIQVLKLSS